MRDGSSCQRRVVALPAVNDPHAASIWAFVSRSTSAYTLVVSVETWPSHARILLISTPAFETAPYGLFRSFRVVILPTRRTQRMRRPRGSGRRMSSDCRRSACYWVERISLSSRSLLSTLNTPNVVRATISAFRRSTSELTTPVRVTWPFSTTT
jgi:hypothetical protein